MTKRVLVTGGTGFIGRWAVAALVAKGYEVHVCARHPPAQAGSAAHFHAVDLFAHEAVEALVRRVEPTHLLHFAWEGKHGVFWTSESNLQWIAATMTLVRAAVSVGCMRIVASGTCAEYDWTDGGVFDELRGRVAPATLYGSSKAAVFLALRAYCLQAKTRFAWGRIFYQYGPYEYPQRIVPAVIRSVLAGSPVDCSHGEQLRDFSCSIDVGEAFAAVLDSDVEGPVNIGSGRPVRLKELILEAAGHAGDATLVRLGARPTPVSEPLVLLPNVSRLHGEVGWRPRFDLSQGLSEAVSFWRRSLGR